MTKNPNKRKLSLFIKITAYFLLVIIFLIAWFFIKWSLYPYTSGLKEFRYKLTEKIKENNNTIIGIHLKDVIDFEADKICIEMVDIFTVDFSSDKFQKMSGFKARGSVYIGDDSWAVLYLNSKEKKVKAFVVQRGFPYSIDDNENKRRFLYGNKHHCYIDEKFDVVMNPDERFTSIHACFKDPVFKEVPNDDPKYNSAKKIKCILTESEN